ncbi:MAG: glycosyltransferase family 2 protein [Rhodospirillaceae bacterium]|nr:glycosyltransferase family 2 protein [Rhodospirillaceae bacterium]
MPQLSVVIPTFNERENVPLLIARLGEVLAGLDWEAVVVDDDSPDGTAEVARGLAQQNPRVRVIHRIGRRGLSTAVVEGIQSSSAPYAAVIDADLQHDEAILPRMVARLEADGLDVVVGSRHVEGGGLGNWNRSRVRISQVATRLAQMVLRADLSDPMSGFFVVRRAAFDRCVHSLSGQGFKILVDLFASAPEPLRFAEEPYVFRLRQHGESKLDSQAMYDFLVLLADKTVGRFVPTRFLIFAAVGGLGIGVHLAALALLLNGLGVAFWLAQAGATLTAMTSNFLLNNAITFRDRRLKGLRLLVGLVSFYAVCSVGAVANVGIAELIYRQEITWWLAGIAGALVGAVWNYAASSIVTWRSR